ncbi:MAG: 3-phosphoshikimate 1-carboxyvinyltransferase [Bacteroidales bacterium]
MQHIVNPSAIKGVVQAPPSKSAAQRAIAIASMAPGLSRLHYPGHSEDVKAAAAIGAGLGAQIQAKGHVLLVYGGLQWPSHPLDCKESGLCMRMFSAIAALFSNPVTITGQGSLLERPMDMVSRTLGELGVGCSTNNGRAPLKITGPLPGGRVKVDGSASSQTLTGLLIAAPYAAAPMEIHVENLKSRRYIDLTLQGMAAFGIQVAHENYQVFRIDAPQEYIPADFVIEGDWSGAAFLLVAGAIAGELTLTNLKHDSFQPDRAILEVLQQSGAKVQINSTGVTVRKQSLQAFDFDATHCPDLFPPLVALAAHCKGTSAIRGVHRLFGKESDRAATLQQEFGKLGVLIVIEGDVMKIRGGIVGSAVVDSHHDHRIAMACAVAALAGEGPVTVMDSQAVNKSFPGFFDVLEDIRAQQDSEPGV